MDQLKRIAAGLTLTQKLSVALAVVAAIAGLYWGAQWNKERDMKPLFTGLSAEDAGAVVEKLKTVAVPYKVSDTGGVISVPSARVAELRLEMAAAGLPKTGRLGFELFDKTNFGITEFSEQVNYRRAIEGELERSVMALAEVERARVHVTFAKQSVFVESREAAKASVMVKLKPGAQLSPQNVMAITHLTASAVEGLAPEQVSVLDMSGNLLNKLRKPSALDASGYSDEMIEYRQAVEKDLLAKIHATLDPLLGPEKFRVGVSAECDFTSGEQSEESFDPGRSVMLTSQKSEDVAGAGGASGVPGTASSLPRPTSRPGFSSNGVARRTENIAFQTSRTVRHTKIPQGTIKRLSVAILVDQNLRWEGSGAKAKRVLEPPAPEKLKIVHDVVAGTIGFQQDRGDQVLVETLAFEATANAPPPESQATGSAPPQGQKIPVPNWLKPLAGKAPLPVLLGVAGAVLLALLGAAAWFVLRKRGKKSGHAVSARGGGHLEAHAPRISQAEEGQLQSPADDAEQRALAQLAEAAASRERQETAALAGLLIPSPTKKAEVLKKHLTEEAKRSPESIAQLVRTWLNEEAGR